MDRIINRLIVSFSILHHFCKTSNDTTLNITASYNKSPFIGSIPMRYIDGNKAPKDFFFDRIVYISMNKGNYTGDGTQQKHISLGVFIDNERLLTSYNPFRALIEYSEELEHIRACFLKSRRLILPTAVSYKYDCLKIKYGRPLIPMEGSIILPDQWHGIDKKHSPLHDLMILRVDDPVEMWTPEGENTFEERWTPEILEKEEFLTSGPSLTKIASGDEEMDKTYKFVALGLRTMRQAKNYVFLQAAYYDESKDVLVDCDEWLPRHWGYFICILNDDTFVGFSSGAMLFSNKSLFGVGSFTMWRGKTSILVFTDVRPYTEHINYTCTDIDLKF